MAAATSTSTSPTPSDTTSVSESGISQLTEPVRKCLRALEAAETDTEKFATLFLVPKLVKGVDCDKTARLFIMKGIGYSFIARMLRSKDSPEGCPRLMFRSVALSVLSCFVGEEEIMTHPSVLFNIPVLLDTISDADNEIYEENLMIITDAYLCLTSIVCTDKGRAAFISNRGIHYLCDIIKRQIFQHEDALKLLLSLLSVGGHICWNYHQAPRDFNEVMLKLCSDFSLAEDASKFELCVAIRTVLRSFPKSSYNDDEESREWLGKVQKGLRDILFSKIGRKQRDPAIMLVAAVIEVSDPEWCLIDDVEYGDGNEKGRFFLIVVNLACIEVIMYLEEEPLNVEQVLENSELLVACYYIMESAVSFMSNGRLLELDRRQKDQLFTALKNGFGVILKFIDDLQGRDPDRLEDISLKHFLCATIRILGAWLSEETATLREEVYAILPFIMTVAKDTFEAQKCEKLLTLPGRGNSKGFSNFTEESVLMQKQGAMLTPDTLRFILPALCHLVVEDKPRRILLDMQLHETLHLYLAYHWSIFDSFKQWLNQQATADQVKVAEPKFMIESSRFEMDNSKYAMISICNILMNLIVLEPQFVDETAIFFHVLRFIMSSLPSLTNDGEQLLLYANLSVLGLLILKHHSHRPQSTEYSVYKYIQAVVRFLWDAHNCEESLNEDELSVSSNYLPHWNDVRELWFLGMQVLNSLLPQLTWIGEFIMDSGWSQEVVAMLGKVRRDGLDQSVKSAYEDFLCSLLGSGAKDAVEQMKKNGSLIAICQTHRLKDLASLIANSSQ